MKPPYRETSCNLFIRVQCQMLLFLNKKSVHWYFRFGVKMADNIYIVKYNTVKEILNSTITALMVQYVILLYKGDITTYKTGVQIMYISQDWPLHTDLRINMI